MIHKLKWILSSLTLATAILMSPFAFASKYVTIDDHSHALSTPLTITARADIDKTSYHTGFVISGIFNSEATHKRHLMALAGTVNFTGTMEEDGILSGGEVHFAKSAQAFKDLRLIGGSVTVEGQVHHSLTVMAGEVSINGKIAGDLDIVAKSIHFGPSAQIIGQINYTSQTQPIIDAGASLAHQPKATVQAVTMIAPEQASQTKRNYALLMMASFGILAALWAWLFPDVIRAHHDLISQTPGTCLAAGIGALLLLPLLGMMAMGTVVGMTLGLVLIIICILLNTLGFASMGFSVGAGLVKMCQRPAMLDDRRWLPVLAAFGITGLILLAFYVKFGFVIDIAAFVIGLGALVQLLWRGYKGLSHGKMALN